MKLMLNIMLLTALATGSALTQANQSAESVQSVNKALSAFAWEKRQILLFAPDQQDANYRAFIAAAGAQVAEFTERRLQVWSLVDGQPVTLEQEALPTKLAVSDFQSAYGVAADEFRVILIGYDQGEKLRQDSVDIEYIFATIDQMPMRIQEMRRESREK